MVCDLRRLSFFTEHKSLNIHLSQRMYHIFLSLLLSNFPGEKVTWFVYPLQDIWGVSFRGILQIKLSYTAMHMFSMDTFQFVWGKQRSRFGDLTVVACLAFKATATLSCTLAAPFFWVTSNV